MDDESSGTDSNDEDNTFLFRSVLKPQESQPLTQHVPQQIELLSDSHDDELVGQDEEQDSGES